jgi:hypothetical protein
LLLEPSEVADPAGQRACLEGAVGRVTSRVSPRGPSFDLNAISPRSALGFGALAVCLIGLLGTDAGLVWLVAGVFTVRSLQGRPVGMAWGVACIGAGVRWGTLGLGDVEAATRLLGPTVLSGGVIVRGGMAAALVAAVAGESRIDGLRAYAWPERVVAVVALVALAAAFVVEGPAGSGPGPSLGAWAVAGVVLAGVVLAAAPLARRLPAWAAPIVAVAGVVAAGVFR